MMPRPIIRPSQKTAMAASTTAISSACVRGCGPRLHGSRPCEGRRLRCGRQRHGSRCQPLSRRGPGRGGLVSKARSLTRRRKAPKVISLSDPASAWTAKANKRVELGYGLNCLIDTANAVSWMWRRRLPEPMITRTQPHHKYSGVALAIRLYNRLVQENGGQLLSAIGCGYFLPA